MTESATSERFEFQAEVRQVLDLMVHSLYSNKEIFLRELISNASDACDKLRFEALSDDSLLAADPDLAITVSIDKESGTLTIADNGIGMTRDELIENVGTIAHSGTRRYLESLSTDAQSDSGLIGQFGVGFYSAFIVAETVELITSKAGTDEAWLWRSDGAGEYELEPAEPGFRGTRVVLHLKETEAEFLESFRVKSLIKQYSDHIGFPILMAEEKDSEDEVAEELVAVNQASALWTLPKNDVSDEDYQNFYQHLSHDINPPLAWAHNHVEGTHSYKSLLFLPSSAPLDLALNREQRQGLKLYIKRVFIMDAAEQLLPHYLRFVRGVVDSQDLPLNVSRELLQENSLVRSIRSGLVKRVLATLSGMAERKPDDYRKFWNEMGSVLKEGMVEDFTNKDAIAKLLRFRSTLEEAGVDQGEEDLVSLDAYKARMKPDQKAIYFLTAENHATALNSPHLEVFRKHGIEVLLMSDRVDEWMMGYFTEFEETPLKSVAKGDISLEDLGTKDLNDSSQKEPATSADLIEKVQTVLKDEVNTVRSSVRLTDSPACLVMGEHDMAMHMMKLMKQAGHEMPLSKPDLEINLSHPLVIQLDNAGSGKRFEDLSRLIYEQAFLAEGGQLSDPAAFVKRMNRLFLSMNDEEE